MKLANANKNKTFGWLKTDPDEDVIRMCEVLWNAKKTHGRKWRRDLQPLGMFDMSEETWPHEPKGNFQSERVICASHTLVFLCFCFFYQILIKADIFTSQNWQIIVSMWRLLCFCSLNIVFIMGFLTWRPRPDGQWDRGSTAGLFGKTWRKQNWAKFNHSKSHFILGSVLINRCAMATISIYHSTTITEEIKLEHLLSV